MTVTTTPPLHLHDLFSPAELQAEIDAKFVTRKQHPTLPLSIYTYSRAAQYANYWTPVTTRCRGLVVDDTDGRIVAHCLPKFFNHSQHGVGYDFAPPLPADEPFEVYDKVDGSLGIVFHYDGGWHAASKGSFISDQAAWASGFVAKADTSALDPSVTYLAEIVYPENRIVVNYGDRRDLVLLAAFRADGTEVPLREATPAWDGIGSVVRTYDWSDTFGVLAALAERNQHLDGADATGTDAEGWVIRFASGLRCKTKVAEYVRLHRALTGTNARDIWQYLGAQMFGLMPAKTLGQALGCSAEEAKRLSTIPGGALSKLLENVPDEYDAWVRGVVRDLQAAASVLHSQIEAQFKALAHLRGDRAAFARAAQSEEDRTVRAALFLVLDGKLIDLHVWRAIRPEPSDPFKNDEEG